MPQMSPMLWVFLFLTMLLMYLSIMNFFSVHSHTSVQMKNIPSKKNSMEW